LTGQSGPALRLSESTEVEIDSFTTSTPVPDAPVLQLANVDGAFVHGCQAGASTQVFLSVNGKRSRGIALRANHLDRARQPLHLGADVGRDAVTTDLPGL
jgi:hypothetical protein